MSENASRPGPVIVDLGKKKKKEVKALRQGEGKLMNDVRDAVEELASAGTVANGAQPVIVIVESKPKKTAWTDWM